MSVGPRSCGWVKNAGNGVIGGFDGLALMATCPRRQLKPSRFLVADVIADCLEEAKSYKRSYRDDHRYGDAWSARFAGRTIEEVTPAEIERVRPNVSHR